MRLPQSIIQSLFVRKVHLLTIVMGTLLLGMVPMAVAAATPQLVCTPSSLRFGSVVLDQTETLLLTLTNNGQTSVTVSGMAVNNSEFTWSPLPFPLVLPAGESIDLSVSFMPTAMGWTGGTIKFATDASKTTLNLSVEGTGVSSEAVTANPSMVSFGQVAIGTSSTVPVVLTNARSRKVTLSAVQITGSGFSVNGLAFPLTLDAGQRVTLNIAFTPQSAGTTGGSVLVSGPALAIPLTGTGGTPGQIAANPPSLTFGNVQVGSSASLSETLSNTGGSPVDISQANLSGAGFSISGLGGFPVNLTPNHSVTFTATFMPTNAGAASGTLSVVSNASDSPLNIALSGTGTAAGQLGVSPTSLSFGNVVVGSSSSLNGSLTASGAPVTVQPANDTSSEFVLSGISLPTTIPAGHSTAFTVTFTPQSSGATSASLSFPSNASNSPAVQTMTGTGQAAAQPTVELTWNTSAGAVGYNIYRGTASGGPYTMINTSLDGTTSYSDSTVVSGQTYYYVTTAVNSESQQSGYSNQATAVIPNP
jgi:Abnormal spindle-like microcephaly-assoc'd, ASPM-SPD-2-Hydin